MGQHYISRSREAAIEASGRTLAELIDLGLETVAHEEAYEKLAAKPLASPRRRKDGTDCPHPPGRRSKGGSYCGACGMNVG